MFCCLLRKRGGANFIEQTLCFHDDCFEMVVRGQRGSWVCFNAALFIFPRGHFYTQIYFWMKLSGQAFSRTAPHVSTSQALLSGAAGGDPPNLPSSAARFSFMNLCLFVSSEVT